MLSSHLGIAHCIKWSAFKNNLSFLSSDPQFFFRHLSLSPLLGFKNETEFLHADSKNNFYMRIPKTRQAFLHAASQVPHDSEWP